jgi:hypothetical protein
MLGSAYKEGVLELNASDDRYVNLMQWKSSRILKCSDRGIDVVRNKIKAFAQKKVTLPPGRHKIIILDEADRFVTCLLHSYSMAHPIQHDRWRAASSPTNNGDLLKYNTILLGLQHEHKDH